MQLHIAVGDARRGPYSLEQINRAIASGKLPVEGTLAWWDGQPSWVPLTSVPGIQIPGPVSSGVIAAPPLPPIVSPPPLAVPAAMPPAATPQGDVTGGLIPYKNQPALLSYYFGVFSIIPGLGLLLGLAALVLGVIGLNKRSKEPHVKGTAHAIIGMVVGGISVLAHLLVMIEVSR